jgi:hypothetical protein
MIFLGMAFWYKETSASFMAGRKATCAGISGVMNSTDPEIQLIGSEPDEGDPDSQIQGIFKTFVKLIYLEEILHYSIEEVFNIF